VVSSAREAKRRRGLWYLVLIGLASLALVATLVVLQPFGGPLDWGIRATALLGYLGVFLAAVSSAYMRQLFLVFGRPFIRVHHVFSVAALGLITLHPIGVAVRSADLGVFLPKFSSLYLFLSLGGRPAWYLICTAALAALFRKTIRESWRSVHFLNYVAFWLATAHALMIGTDFVSPIMKAVAVVLALTMAAVFVLKRAERMRARRRR
jgi:DMSO/TMAO reductase YedYZ heme-binding membrane subunit